MLRRLLAFYRPVRVIAKELTLLRELYELDLAARGITRLTEQPKESDTEVSYMGQPATTKSRWPWGGEAATESPEE